MNNEKFESLVHLVEYQGATRSNKLAYQYLEGGEREGESITFGELSAKCKLLASNLLEHQQPDANVVLLLPSGISFILAFFGSMFARIHPIPVSTPKPKRQSWHKVRGIMENGSANVVITDEANLAYVNDWLSSEDGNVKILTVESLLTARDVDNLPAAPQRNDLCFLQYTSGSTGAPKGVMVSHNNLLHNSRVNRDLLGHNDETRIVCWLPLFHDLGLIGNLIQNLFIGGSCYFMSPTAFIERPIRWLAMVTKYRANTIMAPNFAFELCLRKINDDDKKELDLSSLKSILNGAEPIRYGTVNDFTRYFADCGLSPTAHLPAYGLAEATLVVATCPHYEPPTFLEVCESSLADGVLKPVANGKPLVSSGRCYHDQEIRIVDPEQFNSLRQGQIGEIWLKGESMCMGYWENPEATEATFNARTSEGDGPFLRTGDMGFLLDGELFIASRLKDLIIFNGRNIYPHDVEIAVEASSPEVRNSYSSAFSIVIDGEEKLVVVAEVSRAVYANRKGQAADVVDALTRAMMEELEIWPYDVVLIRPGTLPKTTSGKVQRQLAKRMYLNGEFDRVEIEQAQPEVGPDSALACPVLSQKLAWLRQRFATSYNHLVADERRTLPPNVILDLGNQGLLGMSIPKQYGGLGFNLTQTLKVIEQLGRIDQSAALLVLLNNMIGIRPILAYGSELTKQRWLPALASGRVLGSFAMTEPVAGSNPGNIASTADPVGPGQWQLKGKKIWSGNAGWASLTNVFVKQRDEQGRVRGMTAFLLERGKHCYHQGEEALTMGMRGMIQNSLYLDGALVECQDILGEQMNGMAVAQDAMSRARIGVAAAALGGIKRALQYMHTYSTRRSVSTGLLAENPFAVVTKRRALFAIQALESLLYKISSLADAGIEIPVALRSCLKIAGSEWLWGSVDDALQLLGGRGYIETNGVAQLMRDARVMRIFEGPTETLAMHITAALKTDSEALFMFIRQHLLSDSDVDSLQLELQQLFANEGAHLVLSGEKREQEWRNLKIGLWFSHTVMALFSRHNKLEGAAAFCLSEAAKELNELTQQHLYCLDSAVTSDAISAIVEDAVPESAVPYPDVKIDEALRNGGGSVMAGAVSHWFDEPTRYEASPEGLGEPVVDSGEKTQQYLNFVISWLRDNLRLNEKIVTDTTNFAKLGVDSISATELVSDLKTKFSLELDVTVVWDYTNPTALAEHLAAVDGSVTNRAAAKLTAVDADDMAVDELADLLRQELRESSV